MITKKQIKYIRSLQQKKYRDQHGVFLAEGIKIVSEAIESRSDLIEQLILTEKHKADLPIPDHLDKAKILEVKGSEFQNMSSLKQPQEVLAVIKQALPDTKAIQKPRDLILALDRVRDPGNLGTIIRVADWFGVQHVVCSNDTVDCYNPKVVQASMGSIFRVQVHYLALTAYLKSAKQSGDVNIYGTMLA